MKKKFVILLVVLALSALLVTACASTSEPADDDHETSEEHMEGDEHSEDEHNEGEAHAHEDPPEAYADLTNPFADDHEAIEAGATVYEIQCATCHGPEGQGDGPAAEELDPQPASLADAHMMEELTDGYLFWRVSEGGIMEPFNSAMPPWKDVLSEDERWQVIAFIREFSEDDHD